jgi:hypothetical protein
LGLAVFFWETAKKENPDNPVNPVKHETMERLLYRRLGV